MYSNVTALFILINYINVYLLGSIFELNGLNGHFMNNVCTSVRRAGLVSLASKTEKGKYRSV